MDMSLPLESFGLPVILLVASCERLVARIPPDPPFAIAHRAVDVVLQAPGRDLRGCSLERAGSLSVVGLVAAGRVLVHLLRRDRRVLWSRERADARLAALLHPDAGASLRASSTG